MSWFPDKARVLTLFLVLFVQMAMAQENCENFIVPNTNSIAGPFEFSDPVIKPDNCMDWMTTSSFAYIVLPVQSGGLLNLKIEGDHKNGLLDMAVYRVPEGVKPCAAIMDQNNLISCDYDPELTDNSNQLGSEFKDIPPKPAPIVNSGDIIVLIIENWNSKTQQFFNNCC